MNRYVCPDRQDCLSSTKRKARSDRHVLPLRCRDTLRTGGGGNAAIDRLGSARINILFVEAEGSAATAGLGAAKDDGQRALSVRRNCQGGIGSRSAHKP